MNSAKGWISPHVQGLASGNGIMQGAWFGPPCPKHTQLFQDGLRHLNEGRLGEAEGLFNCLLTLEPADTMTEHCLGVVWYRRGEHERALARINKTVAAYPKHPDFHSNRGLVLAAMGRLDEAQDCYRRALALDPSLAPVHSNLAKALHAQGKLREAIQWYEHSVEVACSLPSAWNDLAAAYFDDGWLNETQTRERCARLRRTGLPGSTAPWVSAFLCVAGGERGDGRQVIEFLRSVFRTNSNLVRALQGIGALLVRQGRLASAFFCYEAAYLKAGDPLLIRECNALVNQLAHVDMADRRFNPAASAFGSLHSKASCRSGRWDFYVRAASVATALGSAAEAERLFAHADASESANVGLLFMFAKVLHINNRPQEAERCYRKVLSLMPEHSGASCNLGALLQARGQRAEAEALYAEALAKGRSSAIVHDNLALLLMQGTGPEEAEKLTHKKNRSSHCSNIGQLLMERESLPEAERCFRRAIELDAANVDAHFNLGVILGSTPRQEEAEYHYRAVIRTVPTATKALINLAALLQRRGLEFEAANWLKLAIGSALQSPLALHDLAGARAQSGEFADAEFLARRALETWTLASDPQAAEAEFHLSLLLLSSGRYSEGWPLYEARNTPDFTTSPNAVRGAKRLELRIPQWRGETIEGKRILLHHEQGFGDNIQFCRYAALLKERGASVVDIICPPELRRLFASIRDTDRVLSSGDYISSSDYDFWTFLLSIPLHFNTTVETIPAAIPYLQADRAIAKAWGPRLSSTGVKVGIVWRGSSSNLHDKQRSLPSLGTLSPLWTARDDAVFVSLQKAAGEAEAMVADSWLPLIDVGSELQDFADTAAVLENLDLLISVDTAVTHLAGALGKPCWILLHAPRPDWRWMRGRNDSPWYPGCVRLFRQEKAGNWKSVVENVSQALRDFVPQRQHQ